MTLAPRSLLWRAFLLIASVIVLAIAAWVLIFRAFDVEPRTKQIAQMVVSVVNLTRSALINAKPELRRELLLDLAEQEDIRIYPAERGEKLVVPPQDRPMLNLLSAEIRKHLGDKTRIALERNGERGFWVSFAIGEDQYWIELPRERVERQLALQWMGWASLVLILALFSAYIIVFRLRRPLGALTEAARAIGRGRRPPHLDESGPEEIQTVSRAFNSMASDLARLDEDRALILAGVSHDLRTPLTRMRLGLEVGPLDPQVQQGMISDIDEMDRIIGQFLDFARGAAGEEPQQMDLAQIGRDVARHYRETGHALEEHIGDVPTLRVRPLALRRVISNLLDNAYRYAKTGVELHVENAGDEVLVRVLDRGPGIPAEDSERMKQPFTRMQSARTNAGGSGLGLAIVERIAQMHGGRFHLLPREGGGLEARICLPIRPQSSERSNSTL